MTDFAQWPCEHVSAASTFGVHYGELDRVYELASVTKLLSAFAVLVAVEEEAIALEDRIGPTNATVAELLSHTGGVGFQRQDSTREPNTRRVYSSYGFELVAEHLEQAAGMPFAQYLDEALCQPLGMGRTELWGSPGHEARSTANDLLLFAKEVLRPTLLHPSTVRNAIQNHGGDLPGVVPGYGNQKPCPWGLGFEIKGSKSPHWTGTQMPEGTVGHFGQSGTYLWIEPKAGHAAVVLTDRAFGDWAKPLWADTNDELWRAATQRT